MTDHALQHPKLFHFLSALDEDLPLERGLRAAPFVAVCCTVDNYLGGHATPQ